MIIDKRPINRTNRYYLFYVWVVLLLSCSQNIAEQKQTCDIKKVDIYPQIKSLINPASDSGLIDLKKVISFDSVFIYGPYSSLNEFDSIITCSSYFDNILTDESNCLLIFLFKGNLTYSIIPRYIDFSSISGKYSWENIDCLQYCYRSSGGYSLKLVDKKCD